MQNVSWCPKRACRLAVLLLLLGLVACAAPPTNPAARLTLADALGRPSTVGFEQALAPRPFIFPDDHGAHPSFAAEWWYYTGNLATADGRRFGFQLTFFRFGLAPQPVQRPSDWSASSIYMAHFALSDIDAGTFYAFERFSRGAAGLAGAESRPFQVWLDDWRADGQGPLGTPIRLRAAQGDIALDLILQAGKPIVLQGDQGLSQKSAAAGNASYYYSMTRMPAQGNLQTPAGSFAVSGLAWMDREWSTTALGQQQLGWDWFALQLDSGDDLMYYRLRMRDGSDDPYSKGILVAPDGSTTLIGRDSLQLDITNTWMSPSGTVYPAGWRIRLPTAAIDLTVTPLIPNQELPLTVTYWEGAVQIVGSIGGKPVAGSGYVELTGYIDDGVDERLSR